MKETKVYVDELPESCKKCAYSQINLALGVETRICGLQYGFISIDIDKFPNCPLQSLQIHDRELVAKVCEKIKEKTFGLWYFVLNEQIEHFEGNRYVLSQKDFNDILDQIQKEFEDE